MGGRRWPAAQADAKRVGRPPPPAPRTDGVWEFLPSQRCIDLVSKFDNPFDAAKAVVASAYKMWLQKETRTDDISAVVIFFDWKQGGSGGGSAGSPGHSRTVSLNAVAK